ncbi:MAG: Mth938-like domain-containing protein [Acidiferrobacterales bacterium]
MGLQLDTMGKDSNIIRSYSPGEIRIKTGIYTQSLVLSASVLHAGWPLDDITALEDSHIELILEQEPELILLGTGARLVFPSAEKLRPIIERGIGYEIMDTAAACRTYNVLVGEGRHVVAGLIIGKDS